MFSEFKKIGRGLVCKGYQMSPQSNVETLFRPFCCKSLRLKNRVVMAPMNRGFAENGVPSVGMAAYYRRRAQGGVGLILSEATVVGRPAAANRPNVPAFHGEAPLRRWQEIIDAVHAADGLMGPQIWHVGGAPDARTDWRPDAPPESPSGLYGADLRNGVAMTEEDLADTIAAFADAAEAAKRLGFDTVEIHGAHGYLLDQFFWKATNLRNDRFGGRTIAERATFSAELVSAVRARVGGDFPIIFRISQWKQIDYSVRMAETPSELEAWLRPLVDAGVDIIDCSQRRFWHPEFPDDDGPDGLNIAGWAKKLTGLPTISVGSVGLSGDAVGTYAGEVSRPLDIELLLERMERGDFDLIAVGRALLADPNWLIKVRAGDHEKMTGFDREALALLF